MPEINDVPKLTPQFLERVYDRAKSLWLSASNSEYTAEQWVTVCYIRAYSELSGLPVSVLSPRDPIGNNPED